VSEHLLEVDRLSVTYGRHRVLSNISLTVRSGEILGVIGETGSGKTTLARAMIGLAPVTAGRIEFAGTELTALRGRALRDFRRSGVLQYMFQDPLRALDPQQTVSDIVGEGMATATPGLTRPEIVDRVAEAMRAVGLDPALAARTPGQLSGGQRQRVLLARAVAPRPRLLLCDEPVSALDASNRNHVLRLLDELRRTGLTIVVISHDLSSLAGIADRVAVLYGGRLVEQGPIGEVLADPWHPYTALLTASAPSVRRERRFPAAWLRPDPSAPARLDSENTRPATSLDFAGCVYAARCRFADTACRVEPATTEAIGGRRVSCHHADTWPAELVTSSRLSQGCTGQHALVQIERYDGAPPPVTVTEPPRIHRRSPPAAISTGEEPTP
jgi:oligopeptide/dipeptide ABC transporter ATP-binding protein